MEIEEITKYLRQMFGKVPVDTREKPFTLYPEKSLDYARKLASIRIHDVRVETATGEEPLYGEVQYEHRKILGQTMAFGVLYDGFYLQRVFSELIPAGERGFDIVNIFITNRLLATWEEGERRYHLRTSVYGFPSVISTTGIVEAPARPREYYLLKQQYEALGKDLLELKEKFKGSFIDYEDDRLTKVMKGYAVQAVFYAMTGHPFCEDKGCRLYNAHWQEEVIFAQLENEYEFCPRHTEYLKKMRGT
ncbi:MAG: hypothetical protein A2144_08335 [Chloroflexi bacterium RBG_16_50_9]|nr:MAG: hypothetical protein A2144_08335 [Chloroflexi bacterium RBG_16_50_9]